MNKPDHKEDMNKSIVEFIVESGNYKNYRVPLYELFASVKSQSTDYHDLGT